MRDLSGRTDFQLRLKIEKQIAELFPDQFMTQYAMVTFSDLSYAEAKRRAEKQNELLDQILAIPGIDSKWDGAEVKEIAAQWLSKNKTNYTVSSN